MKRSPVLMILMLSIFFLTACSETKEKQEIIEDMSAVEETTPRENEPVPEIQEESASEETRDKQIFTTLDEIKAKETPMKCTWETAQAKGTAWVYGDFLRTESVMGGKTYYLADDGVYRYSWTGGAAQGTKISSDLQKQMELKAGVKKTTGEYFCEPTSIEPGTFNAPEGISFFDVSG